MAMAEKPLYLTVAVFYTLIGAQQAAQHLRDRSHFKRGAAALVVEKDLRGELHAQEVGLTPVKGAAGGMVLGAIVGVLTGGTALALGALGGALGGLWVKRSRRQQLSSGLAEQLSAALVPGTSAILVTDTEPLPEAVISILEERGAEVFRVELGSQELDKIQSQADAAYSSLAHKLEAAGSRARAFHAPYPKIHVVINPAAGKDEPILNVLNRVFRPYNVEWNVSLTQTFGDAEVFARAAVDAGYDLVVGYGGDGTQHEIANAVMGSGIPMGVLPGGTGNGFANELGIPKSLAAAAEVLCTSRKLRSTDIVQLGKEYFIQRLYVGVEPEQQTSRQMKDKYGTLAYALTAYQQFKSQQETNYRITIDGQLLEQPAVKVYVVNAAQSGTGISVTGKVSRSDDGLLDVFVLDAKNLKTFSAAAGRMLNLDTQTASQFIWQGQEISIETEPDQPVWTDGEYYGRTPLTVKVIPGGLKVVVPESVN
jgi:diacylglycerol kinase (ATP)